MRRCLHNADVAARDKGEDDETWQGAFTSKRRYLRAPHVARSAALARLVPLFPLNRSQSYKLKDEILMYLGHQKYPCAPIFQARGGQQFPDASRFWTHATIQTRRYEDAFIPSSDLAAMQVPPFSRCELVSSDCAPFTL